MRSPVLVDTGPLVAILNASDSAHQACREQLAALSPPLLTTWPVITEAAFLLRSNRPLIGRLIQSVAGGFLRLAWLDEADALAMAAILARFEDQSFQVADVSLMHLANRESLDTVFTLDIRDFSVFRKDDGSKLHLLPSDA